MVDDAELLRRYSGAGSEAAFTEWVGRHLDLVYFTALRRTGGDAALAQEVAQAVFTTAARKSTELARHLTLTGWLYTTTCHLADKAVRKEQTRRRYERDAAMHELTIADPFLEWERLRPIIDDALVGLEQGDREAILIRFFEGRAFAEMGATLRISPDAARMRVERALDKLRKKLEQRGIQSASAALALALSTQSGLALPAGMITAVSGAAVASAAGINSATILLGFMSTTKTTVVAAAVATALATGFGLVERNRARAAETRLDTITQEQTSLRARLARTEHQLAQAKTRAAEADKDSGRLLAAVEAARAKPASLPRVPGTSAARTPSAADDPLTHSLQAIFPNGIVVTMGDKTVTVDDIRRELAPLLPKLQAAASDDRDSPAEFSQRLNSLQNDVVKKSVERILLLKEFSNHQENEAPRQIPEAYVDRAFADRLKENFANDPARLATYLESRGLTQDQYRQALEEEIAYGYMISQQRKLDKNTKTIKSK